MRLKFSPLAVIVVIAIAVFLATPPAPAQRADTMMPEVSAVKAKQIVADLINALGGPGFTEARESQCQGRRALFGHNNEMTGLIDVVNYRHFPDKDRTEYIAKGRNTIFQSLIGLDGLDLAHGGVVITLFNGNQGWSYDRSGVNVLPATAVSDFQEQMQCNSDNLLRFRLKEPGMDIRYGGTDTVDLKQVDWVEITDSAARKFRLAVDRSTHFLVRSVVTTQDQETQQINEDVTIFANYQLKDSVWVPLQITREHNGRRTAQIFYETCRFNPGLPDGLFTKDSLRKGGSETVLKKK